MSRFCIYQSGINVKVNNGDKLSWKKKPFVEIFGKSHFSESDGKLSSKIMLGTLFLEKLMKVSSHTRFRIVRKYFWSIYPRIW